MRRIAARVLLCNFICCLFFLGTAHGGDEYCFYQAGRFYNISPDLLRAISKVESSLNPFALNLNNGNGSIDVCHMQVNSCWKDTIGSGWDYLGNPCYCTYWGAYILSLCITRYGQTWDAVSCYNSNKALYELEGEKLEKVRGYVIKVAREVKMIKEMQQ